MTQRPSRLSTLNGLAANVCASYSITSRDVAALGSVKAAKNGCPRSLTVESLPRRGAVSHAIATQTSATATNAAVLADSLMAVAHAAPALAAAAPTTPARREPASAREA